MTTAADLLREMQSYVTVSEDIITKAEESGINENNNNTFSILVNQWGLGHYDEDPEYVVSEIKSLLR